MPVNSTYLSLLATATIAGQTLAQAQPTPSMCPDHPIRIAYFESGYFYRGGRGVDADVVKELQRLSSCPFDEQVIPRIRAYLLLEQGQLDMLIAAIENPARKHYAYYIPYVQQRFATIILRTAADNISTPAAFTADETLRFGVVRGVSYGAPRDQWLQTLEKAGRVQTAPSPAIAYRMLQAKRFSALFATPLQYEKELAELGMREQVRIVDWFPTEAPTVRHLALSRDNFTHAQLASWEALVRRMRTDGTLQSILGHYLPQAEATKAIPK
jgi:polar amino acid transport system substrate-binding protein